jgi:ElaB/YqjD/DUF883 family membrane-anchored ribosome-binding protein
MQEQQQPNIHELDKLIAILQERLRSSDEALKSQAREYERRLQELNHAHAQQIARNAEYVPRESFDSRNAQIDEWRREVDKWRWISIGAASVTGTVTGIIGALIIRFIGR